MVLSQLGARAIFLPTDGQVDFDVPARAQRYLHPEIVVEVFRILPKMAVYVDQHGESYRNGTNFRDTVSCLLDGRYLSRASGCRVARDSDGKSRFTLRPDGRAARGAGVSLRGLTLNRPSVTNSPGGMSFNLRNNAKALTGLNAWHNVFSVAARM